MDSCNLEKASVLVIFNGRCLQSVSQPYSCCFKLTGLSYTKKVMADIKYCMTVSSAGVRNFTDYFSVSLRFLFLKFVERI